MIKTKKDNFLITDWQKDNELWYKNPIILLKNIDQIYPYTELTYIEKINSIARFGLYFLFIIIGFSQNNKWLLVSLSLFIISYYYSIEPIEINKNINEELKHKTCL